MKRVIILLGVTVIIILSVSGQEKPDSLGRSRDTYLGLTAGIGSSTLYAKDLWYTNPVLMDESVTLNHNPSYGFYFGAFLKTNYSNHFSLLFDISIKESDHDFEYHFWKGGNVSTSKNSVYSVDFSNFFFSVIPSYRFGNKVQLELFAGPCIDIPFNVDKLVDETISVYNFTTKTGSSYNSIYDPGPRLTINGGLELIYGIKMDLPVKTMLLGLELRGWVKPLLLEGGPAVRERFFAATIFYAFRIKHKSI